MHATTDCFFILTGFRSKGSDPGQPTYKDLQLAFSALPYHYRFENCCLSRDLYPVRSKQQGPRRRIRCRAPHKKLLQLPSADGVEPTDGDELNPAVSRRRVTLIQILIQTKLWDIRFREFSYDNQKGMWEELWAVRKTNLCKQEAWKSLNAFVCCVVDESTSVTKKNREGPEPLPSMFLALHAPRFSTLQVPEGKVPWLALP